MSQVFNTCLIEVYNVAMKANTPDREAEWLPGWELPILSCRIFIFSSTKQLHNEVLTGVCGS